MLVLAMAFPISASETPLVGDVNGDGKIAITDVTALIDYLLTNDASLIVMENADVNPDGKVAITDVTNMNTEANENTDLGIDAYENAPEAMRKAAVKVEWVPRIPRTVATTTPGAK